MSTETPGAAPVATQIGSPEQFGAAREARGWSLSDVASKLGMMPRQIEAIEQGRWEALPGHAFVRGAVRAYGKALQVDVAPLLATLGGQQAPELKPSASLEAPLPRRGALGFDNGGSGSRITWILLGLLGVVAIAMYFGRGTDLARVLDDAAAPASDRTIETVPVQPIGVPGPAGAAGAPASASTPAPSGTALRVAPDGAAAGTAAGEGGAASVGAGAAPAQGASPAGAASPSAPGLPGDASSGGAASTVSPSSGAASPAAGAAPAAASPTTASPTTASPTTASPTTASPTTASAAGASDASASNALVFRFERESWIEVRDANGRVLLVGTQPAQSQREVVGSKPYAITVGNAPYVRLEHAGRAVDLGNVTQKGVARLKLE